MMRVFRPEAGEERFASFDYRGAVRIVFHKVIRHYRKVGDAIAAGAEHKRNPRERRFLYTIFTERFFFDQRGFMGLLQKYNK